MAKYYGKQKAQPAPKGKLPLAVLAIVGALVLIVAGVMVLAKPAASGTRAGGGTATGPRLAVDQEKLDFGKVKMNTPVTAAFKVKNTGSEPLQILGQPQVRVVQGC